MKKKILSATFVVAMMAVAGYNVYMNQAKAGMSELALANVEALADDGETNQPNTCGTEKEDIDDREPCQMDNGGYSEGFVGIIYSETTGTDDKYLTGMSGILYTCLSTEGEDVDTVEEYKCGENELSGLF